MQTLLRRIQLAIGTGAALCGPVAACGGESTVARDAGGTYELSELGCAGPFHDGGYYGQCCVEALCYSPTSGGCMTADDSALYSTLPQFPPGSGSCTCALPDTEAVVGPFAKNPANPDEPDGTCCYLVGAISCEGRPLCVEGQQVVARAVTRSDWLLGSLLGHDELQT